MRRRAPGESVDPLRLRVDLFAERLDGALDRPDGVHQILPMGILLAVVFVLDRLDAEDALEPVHEGGVRPIHDDVDDVEAAYHAYDETSERERPHGDEHVDDLREDVTARYRDFGERRGGR